MVKPSKKKGGKKDTPKEQSSESQVEIEESSTSSLPAPEPEEEIGLTGGARKKKEKKEKKEKALQALQALQASRTPHATPSATTSEVHSRAESEALSEPISRAQSEAPFEPSSESQKSKAPSETSVSGKIETKHEEVEEEAGLGLISRKKRKPRNKKTDAPQQMEDKAPSTQPAQTVPVPEFQLNAPLPPPGSASAWPQGPAPGPAPPGFVPPGFAAGPTPGAAPAPVQMSAAAPVQMFAPVTSAPGGPWGRGGSQSAGRGRGRGLGPAITGPSEVLLSGPSQSIPVQTIPSPSVPRPSGPSQSRPVPSVPSPSVPGSSTSTSFPRASQSSASVRSSGSSQKSLEPVLCRYRIPNKIPGCTVRAKPISLLVNYLEMQFKSLKVSRYDVSFSPDRPKKMLTEVFKKVKAKFFPKDLIGFDQMKNCYSLHPLKAVPATERFNTTVEMQDQNGRTMTFEVSMKATGIVDLGNIRNYMTSKGSTFCHPTEEIQCIDVILRQGALESYVKAGRQFFKRPSNPVDLGYGYEMWTGLFQSAIFTNKSFINIDVAHKGFPRAQSLLDALVKDFNLDPSRPLENQRGYDYFAAFVKGLKVFTMLVGDTPSAGHRREYVCNGLAGPPDELTFVLTESGGQTRKVTVADYFAKDKKYRLKYPRLNCLWVGARDKCIYFPIELLHVSYGQPLARQLNDVQVSKMVREAATPPDERLAKIKEVISNMKYSQNSDFKQFGLEISEKFYTVKAKILEPPTLEIGNGKTVPRRGQWQANRLLKPEPLQSWGFIALDTDPRNDYDSMISLLISTGTQMGMSIAKPKLVNFSAKMRSLQSILLSAYRDVRFVFIIVSSRGRDDYHKVKQMAEREVGILTQCVKEMTARRMNAMTAKNILLKVNSKLMGINQAIDVCAMPKCLREGAVMIVGADVTHPSPDQSNVPSIAAVTASLDPKCFIYNIELSIQTPKKEMIVEFEDMMFDHLRVYKERNHNTLPKKIFVFRDGVSEGQFAQVMNSELQAVHNAYQRMAGHDKKPEVLFLLVQKRHHTRLFNEGNKSQFNVEPGTVVDTDIVHASELDFYLVSHQAIKGTARPTRYHAVCNDGKIPDDEVEQLTYYLCHLYSRCMRSVSYPTPTYYAHLACLRARSLTHGERFDNRELERKPKRLHVLDKMLQFSRMFFV